MAYLNTETGEYPRFDGDLELLGWVKEEPLPENWVSVEEIAMPEFNSFSEVAVEDAPIQNESGNWEQKWVVRNMNSEEVKFRNVMKTKLKIMSGQKITAEEAMWLVN
jgi:hypothetical protein